MAKLKSVLVFVAEILVHLREDLEVNTFPFIFLWVDNDKAIDVYVEKDDGTYKYHITSPDVEFARDITPEQGPVIEEFTLTGRSYLNPRTRKIQTFLPGECIGVGSILCDTLPGDASVRDCLTHALRRYVEDKDTRELI